jgi:hypothetical protein
MFSSIWSRYPLLTIVVLLIATRREALACPLCFASSNASVLHAFYLTTGLLILLPLLGIGVVALTLIRFSKDGGTVDRR